jgi:3-hydroxy-D-aspartate aldolase
VRASANAIELPATPQPTTATRIPHKQRKVKAFWFPESQGQQLRMWRRAVQSAFCLSRAPIFKPALQISLRRQLASPTSLGIPGNMGMDHVGIVVPNAQHAMEFLQQVFHAEFDWEVKREPTPTAGERGWDKLFGVHPDSYMKHVVMLKCGDHLLTQYIELFEWVSPDQYVPTQGFNDKWLKMSDVGNSYISFTVKDLAAVMKHVKEHVMPKWPGVRFIQDPPMAFPLRGEVCASTFLISPWGMWIELTEWSVSGAKGKVVSQIRQAEEDHADVGKSVEQIPTPAMFVDLEAINHNAALMSRRFQQKNIAWRPPCKAHKCPELAKNLQEKHGAQGVVVLTISEAESFADHGIDDIFVANEVIGPENIRRLALLAKRVRRLRVNVDHADNIRNISAEVKRWEITTPIELLVELNIGHNRCG